ncbi:MAG: hypothetical protein AAGA24_02905, partial [Pseudomonadota bacterium]
LPADVFGLDGVSTYPSTVTTGSTVTDSSGFSYDLGPGEFLFPLMAPGEYRLVIESPTGYSFPSLRSGSDFIGLQNAPFEIIDGSFGNAFTVDGTAAVNLDVPLDPSGDLIVRKEASETYAAIGDFIGYTVELENVGEVPAPYQLRDLLPRGLRYVDGTARIDGVRIADPAIQPNGRDLLFPVSYVETGETQRLTYIAAIGPGTPNGQAVNEATAMSASGDPVSNTAEAGITIEDDFLNTTSTIIGRVAEAACQPDEPWARSVEDGIGVPGVRLYMENGRYVVTDADGLYHFEGVDLGTHIVQVDKATLPAGYIPVLCEENTRYAGSALSKFVDAAGGTVWRANFYLERTAAAKDIVTTPDGRAVEIETPGKLAGAELYGEAWLNAQSDTTPRIAYPSADETPRGRSVDVGIVHGPTDRVRLMLNGQPALGVNFAGRDLSQNRSVAVSRWTGIDIQRGENKLVAEITNPDGAPVATIERSIWFVDEVHTATLVADQTVAVADGRSRPVIAIRLEDSAGHAVHAGRIADIDVGSPYRLAQTADREFEQPISAAYANVAGIPVSGDGIAYVELEPTLQAGRVRVAVKLHDERIEFIDVWLEPENREWVLVGLAEAEGLLFNSNDGDDLEERDSDGRIAFFAKGVINGDWLMTLAVDTAKRRGAEDGELFDEIDPNAYYTLYGDRTWQYNDAASRYPVYIKLERNAFQALFGDFDTDLNDTQLGLYSRQLSGLKIDYQGERTSLRAFAAETNQTFRKDELAADGTSGPYVLTRAPIIMSSETITIETRNRVRPDEIRNIVTLSRYVDYDIDYTTGEVFFRAPVAASDATFNPNVIVVDYETTSTAERGLTAGGRLALRGRQEDVEVGLTLITEEDGTPDQTAPSQLVSADATWQVGERTRVRAEVANTSSETANDKTDGNAWLLETAHDAGGLSVTGYYREETAGYGLGQQTAATSNLRRIGANLVVDLGAIDVADGTDRAERQLDAQVYTEENLSTDSRRQVGELALSHKSQAFSANLGLRGVFEQYDPQNEERTSAAIVSGLSKTFVEQGLTLSATREQPVFGGGAGDDESSLFPERTSLGLDKSLGRRATFNLRHEMIDSGEASGDNTIAGLTVAPWTGGQVNAATDYVTQDSGQRLGATVGVDQIWRINPQWSVSVGGARRANLDGTDELLDVADDDVAGIFDTADTNTLVSDDDYTSAYLGAGYRGDQTALSGRIENRDSALGDRFVANLGGAREVTKTFSFSTAVRYQKEALIAAPDSESMDLRLGAAWRPRGDGPVVFNRFDIGHDETEGEFLQTKAVNNLTVNTQWSERLQTAIFHGLKYTQTRFEDDEVSGFTNLIGGELRYDLTTEIDLGVRASWWGSDATSTADWSFGPSVGFSPEKNIWVSLGWNIEGFEDEDFEAASYSRQGPYIKLRTKFDQDTLKSLIGRLGLGAE